MDLRVMLDTQVLQQWSILQAPDQLPHRLELKPGESKTIELIWIPDEMAVLYGVYVTGWLTDDTGHGNSTVIHILGTLRD